MLLAMKDEAGSILKDKETDFFLDNSYGEETMEDLTAAVMLMARIQPADGNTETVPSYDAKAVSEVNASSKVHEQVSHVKRKTIIQTSDDDQINSNIIFDDPYVENNGGMSDHDSNAHDEYHEIQILAYNIYNQTRKMTEQDSPLPTITAMKIPIIKKGEYNIWSMRMRQYIYHTYHNLWDIIVDGDLQEEAAPAGEQSSPPAPKTAKQLTAKRNQERVKSILLLAISDEYLLKFHNVPDAKSLWAAIKSRFRGNDESKKM
ncbi:hypothetical protein Tco_0584950 [Tanacetum coccineum]